MSELEKIKAKIADTERKLKQAENECLALNRTLAKQQHEKNLLTAASSGGNMNIV